MDCTVYLENCCWIFIHSTTCCIFSDTKLMYIAFWKVKHVINNYCWSLSVSKALGLTQSKIKQIHESPVIFWCIIFYNNARTIWYHSRSLRNAFYFTGELQVSLFVIARNLWAFASTGNWSFCICFYFIFFVCLFQHAKQDFLKVWIFKPWMLCFLKTSPP